MRPWLLAALWLVPLVASAWVRRLHRPSSARAAAYAVAGAVLAIAFVALASTGATSLTGGGAAREEGVAGLGVDGLSAVLVSSTSALTALSLLAAPREELDVSSTANVLLLEAGTLGVLVSTNVLLLALFWALSLVPLWLEAARARDRALFAAFAWASALSALPLALAMLALAWLGVRAGLDAPFDVGTLADAGVARPLARPLGALVLVASTARAGVFPLHSWAPAALERGRLAAALSAVVSPVGSFGASRLVLALFPEATAGASPALLACGTASALYGAIVALGQNNARRQLGFLWVSAVGFVFAGLASLDARAMSGALLYDVASTLSVAGLLLIVRAVEARSGTADMRRLGGLAGRAPRLSTAYLLLGVAASGFPGTANYVSGELLVQGIHEEHPFAVAVLLVATALNGVTVVRSFARIFWGPGAAHAVDVSRVEDMLPRERAASFALVAALLAGGLAPAPLLRIRQGVVESLRRATQPGGRGPAAGGVDGPSSPGS